MASPFARAAWLSLVLLLLAAPRVAPASASEAAALSRAPAPAGASLHDKARARSASERERATRSAGLDASSDASAVRFTAEGEARFSTRLASLLQRPCEGYARNLIDEPARDLQHAAVIALREACAAAPPAVPGQTVNPCADLANAVNVVLDHAEATELLKQLLHEKCQSAAAAVSAAAGGARDAARARDAAAFLVADTVRKVAEDEQTLRDYYGVPIDRAEVAKRPRVPEEGVFLLDTKRDGGVATEKVDDESFEFVRGVPVDEIASDDDALSTLSTCSSSRDGEATTCAADVRSDGRLGDSARGVGERRDATRANDINTREDSETSRETKTEPAPTTWRYSGPSASDVSFDPLPSSHELVEEIRRVERVALTDLYRLTEGSRWRRQRNWLSRATHCAWEGVFCASDDQPAGVLGLVLNDNGLSGPLPPTLARLHRLRHLDLRHNALTGEISGAFGAMRGLTSFLVRGNALRGFLPPELGAADKMERLDLSDNAFTGWVPEREFCRFTRLKLFNVSKNGLEGPLPGSMCALPDLEVFSASNNRFTKGLTLCTNALAGQTFGLGSSMRLFDVSKNAIAEPPPEPPVHADKLVIWDVSHNPLSGKFGKDFKLNPNLKVFAAQCSHAQRSGSTAASGGVVSLGTLGESFFPRDSRLRRVDVSGCGLSGSLPDSLMALAHVREVNLSNNAFVGSIPSEGVVDARALVSLRVFDVSRNKLNGSFPAALASLATLRVLDVSRNALTGSLPADDQLASLRWLTKLDVSRNDMEGPIPDSLGKLARGNLRFLDLSANRFNGALPNDLFANNLLTHLDVSGNDLDWSSLGTG